MGFSTILDIMGSMFIGGMLMLILFRVSGAAAENTYNNSQDLIVQQNLTFVVTMMEDDFRKLGYCEDWSKIPDPSKAILYADSNKIQFLTDLNDDGNVDTLTYYTGPTSELASTPNPNDVMLYRVENHDKPGSSNLGITEFNLLYFDTFGDTLSTPVASPAQIATIQISIKVEDTEAYNNQYVDAFWRQVRLSARNLKNR